MPTAYPHSFSDAAIVLYAIGIVLMLASDSLLKQRKFKLSLIVPCFCIATFAVPLLLGQELMREFIIILIALGHYIWKYREEKEKEKSEKK